MQTKFLGALALAPTMVALSIGSAVPANATDKHDDDGWYIYEDTYKYAKGEACSGRVIEHYKSKERMLVENEDGDLEPLTPEEAEAFDPTTLDKGQSWAIETKWGRVHWYSPKTDRHVMRDSSGDFLLTVAGDGNDFRIRGTGNNFFVGVGVKGILQVSGKQKAFIEDFDNEEGGALRYLKVKGHTEQICHTLGLRAVYNAPDEDLYDAGH